MTPKKEIPGGRPASRARLLTLALLIAALLAGLGAVAYHRFDPAYFQRLIVRQMEQRFDLLITLGRYKVKIWPSLGLELEDLVARHKAKPDGEPIIEVRAARFYLRIIPLFWGRFEVVRIVLDEPDLRVTRGPEGRLDVAELLGGDERKRKDRAGDAGGQLFVTRTQINRGRLTIIEKTASGRTRRTRVESLDLTMRDLAYGGEPEFKLAAVMGEPSPGARIRLEGRAGRLERGRPFRELPLDVELQADRFSIGPFRPFLPGKWRERVRKGVITSDLSIAGSLGEDLSVKGDVRIEDADFADHYSLRGLIVGKIDWRGAKGRTRGKADVRLAPGAFVKGSMAIDGDTDIRADFTTGEGGFSARLTIDATGAAYRQGSVFEKPAGTRLTLEGMLGKGASGLEVRDARGRLGDLPFTGSAEIRRPAAPGRSTPFDLHFSPEAVPLATMQDYVDALRPFALGGEATVSRLDIVRRPEEDREYQVTIDMTLAGASATIPLEDGRAHTVRGLEAGVAIVPGHLTAEQARGEINGAPVMFKTDVTEFMAMIAPAQGRPRADIRLEAWGDDIDLDRLLEPAALAPPLAAAPAPGTALAAPGPPEAPAAGAPPPAAEGSVAADAMPLPAGGKTPFLDRFFVKEGIIRAARATYAKQSLTGLESRFSYHNPVLRLQETRFSAHEGDWGVEGTLALNGKTTFDLGVKVAHARVEAISRAFSEKKQEPAIFGMLDGEGELHGQGTTLEDWEKTLTGKGQITVREGRLPGFNIFETVIRAVLGVFAKVIPIGKLGAISGENRFERFDQVFRIEGGRIWSDPIELTTIDYVLRGKGSAGLDRTLDYRTTVQLTPEGTQKMIAVASLPILSGAFQGIAPVPVSIKGTADKPVILPDASVISVGTVEALIRGVGGTAVDRAGDVVQGVGRILGVGSNGGKERKEKKKEGGTAEPPPAPEAGPAGESGPEPSRRPSREEENPDLVDQGLEKLEKLLGR